ncbi:LysR family transcriptional regulator [Paracoccus aurantiacus]|uniref:LysR family transcriptional regulator n=1 Tax=Paracoccus aurantiacus TaxID=2599412 RepID=A0A5C6SA06_9RHOB|nr:LysR family transcriptional regulator [Paracoccus aurantiacus]TXB71214.1 LysR family transcriptional regulator [Paracoccus aurantiacus]
MRVDYLGLEAFVAIAEYGSFQRAARALNLSQAALSHRLRKVEEDLGFALLIRTSREVSLTANGQGLLPDARRLLKSLQETYESARAGASRQSQRFAIACVPTIAHSVLPDVLGALARDWPGTGFKVLDVPVAGISEIVRGGQAEFGLTIVSAELSDLRVRPLADEDYHLFLRRDSALARKGVAHLSDIEGARMARISTQSKNRQLLDVAFGDLRDRLHWFYEVQSAGLAMRLVAEGMAMTILPASAIAMAPASLTSIPFGDVRLQRTIGVVSRRGIPQSDNAVDLLARIEAALVARFRPHLTLDPDLQSRPRD